MGDSFCARWQGSCAREQVLVEAAGPDKYGGADDEANKIDEEVLASLGAEGFGARIGEGPVAVEDEIAGDGDGEGAGLSNRGLHTETASQQVESGEVDDGADCADDGEAQKAGAFFGVGEEVHDQQ